MKKILLIIVLALNLLAAPTSWAGSAVTPPSKNSTNAVLTTPTINTATINSPTISMPSIISGTMTWPTINNAVLTTPTVSGAATLQSGSSLIFPATAVMSANANALDDYEEGSWIPVITAEGPGTMSVAHLSQIGSYVKVGRLVYSCFYVTGVVTLGTAIGNLLITGVPYYSDLQSFMGHGFLSEYSGITKAGYTSFSPRWYSGGFSIAASASGLSSSFVTIAQAGNPTLHGCFLSLVN